MLAVTSLGSASTLKSVSVHVARGSGQLDNVRILARLKPGGERNPLVFSVPRRFKLQGVNGASGWSTREVPGLGTQQDYFAKPLSRDAQYGCELVFAGEIFAKSPMIDSRMSIFTNHDGAEISIPVEVTFADVDEIAFDQLLPNPERRTSHFIWYTEGLWRERAADGTVVLRGVDRERLLKYQFLLFVVATMIGIFAALVTNGLHTLASEYDRFVQTFLVTNEARAANGATDDG